MQLVSVFSTRAKVLLPLKRESMKAFSRLLLLLILLNFSAIALSTGTKQQPHPQFHAGRNDAEFDHKGRKRTALVFVPKNVTMPTQGWPLVMMLHGAGGSARNVIESTGWSELGQKEGFVTVFPNGTPRNERRIESFLSNPQTWNAGEKQSLSSGELSATAKKVDDVGFLGELIARVCREIRIDEKRIYVAGHSNGASMTYRFGAERSDLVAAIGVVAGHCSIDPKPLSSPVPLLQIIGDQDPFTPMAGGEVGVLGRKAMVPPALESPRAWARMLGLQIDSTVVQDDNKLKILVWGPSTSGAEVRSIIIKGHGHAYPSPSDRFHPRLLFGPTVKTLNATETMWRFFREHSKL
jgi:polyhydroxybutyrate depolymerase